MSDIQVFKFESHEIRTFLRDGEPWFLTRDVCSVLDIVNSRDAVARLDDDEKGVVLTDTPGGKQSLGIVNESGLYSLILGSRKPEAKAFKRWVTHDVIPSIRKHGAYMTPQKIEEVLSDPDTIIKLAQQLKQTQEARRQLAAKVEADKPKVVFAEALEISNSSILVGELAKLLKQNGVDVGQNRLFQFLRDEGYLMRTKGERWNDPTQRSMDLGLFEIKKRTINNPDGSVQVVKTTKVTPKGQIYFVNKFKNPAVEV